MNSRDAAVWLSREWDLIVRDGPDHRGDESVELTEVKRLYRLDRQPEPDSTFVTGLEATLMRTAARTIVVGSIAPPPLLTRSRAVALDKAQESPWWRQRDGLPWRRMAAAIAILVAAGALTATAMFSGGGDPTVPTILPAYAAASPDARPWQSSARCDVPPRPTEDFVALLASSERGGAPPVESTDTGGRVADPEVTNAIEAVVTELIACRNARDVARHYALWTDDAILRANLISAQSNDSVLLESLIRSMDYVERLDGTPEPVTEDRVWTFLAVENVVVLSDGRIRATVRFGVPGGALPMEMIFENRNGEFLLDEATGWTTRVESMGTPAP